MRRESVELAAGWRAYLVPDVEEDESEVAFYCPKCAEQEFGFLDAGPSA